MITPTQLYVWFEDEEKLHSGAEEVIAAMKEAGTWSDGG